MSLNQSFRYIGLVGGVGISGLILNLYANNFHIIVVMFGAAAIAAAAGVFWFVKDPTKNQMPPTA